MPTDGPQPIAFDARPLTDPVDPTAVKAFVRQLNAQRGGVKPAAMIAIVIIGTMAAVMAAVLVMAFSMVLRRDSFGAALAIIVVVGVAIAGATIAIVAQRRTRETRYRIAQFAFANHMAYVDQVVDPPLPGMIFSLGTARQSNRVVRGDVPRFVEFGNYQYTVKSGKNSTTYHWGYVAVKLNVPLPNIVLDALGNNGFGSNLPASFRRDQRLSLEGDFDRYFTLYCPAGYERDALYLFTPDIMARFVDNAAQLDVEIVDDWLFLYTKRPAATLDPATWAWLFGAVGALMTKFDQWERWRDENLQAMRAPAGPAASAAQSGGHALPFAAPAGTLAPPPGVAREGRRLKRTRTWLPIVIGVAFFAWYALRIVLG